MMISPDRDIRCNKHMMLNGIGVILVDASRSEEQKFTICFESEYQE